MKNEDYLISLEKQIVLLKKDNDILKDNDIKYKNKINNMEKENQFLKEAIDKYNTIQSIEDITIKNIHNIRNKSFKNNNKYVSFKILNNVENMNNKNIINGVIIKNNYINKKMKQCLSEKNLKIIKNENSKNYYNYNYNYIKNNNINSFPKRNISNGNNIRNLNKENKKSKLNLEKNILYYNTTIKKKKKNNNNNQLNSKDEFYRPKIKLKNDKFNSIKLKNLEDINNKENRPCYNINNLSESRSLLSSYSEEII